MLCYLAIPRVMAKRNIKFPWGEVAAYIGEHVSGNALLQHMSKETKKRASEGRPVPEDRELNIKGPSNYRMLSAAGFGDRRSRTLSNVQALRNDADDEAEAEADEKSLFPEQSDQKPPVAASSRIEKERAPRAPRAPRGPRASRTPRAPRARKSVARKIKQEMDSDASDDEFTPTRSVKEASRRLAKNVPSIAAGKKRSAKRKLSLSPDSEEYGDSDGEYELESPHEEFESPYKKAKTDDFINRGVVKLTFQEHADQFREQTHMNKVDALVQNAREVFPHGTQGMSGEHKADAGSPALDKAPLYNIHNFAVTPTPVMQTPQAGFADAFNPRESISPVVKQSPVTSQGSAKGSQDDSSAYPQLDSQTDYGHSAMSVGCPVFPSSTNTGLGDDSAHSNQLYAEFDNLGNLGLEPFHDSFLDTSAFGSDPLISNDSLLDSGIGSFTADLGLQNTDFMTLGPELSQAEFDITNDDLLGTIEDI